MATAQNNNSISTPATTVAGRDSTHWGLWTSASSGSFLFGGAHANDPAALVIGQQWVIAANAFVVTLAASVASFLSEAGARKMLTGLMSGTVYVSHHSANPGNTGANEFSGSGYARVALAAGNVTIA